MSLHSGRNNTVRSKTAGSELARSQFSKSACGQKLRSAEEMRLKPAGPTRTACLATQTALGFSAARADCTIQRITSPLTWRFEEKPLGPAESRRARLAAALCGKPAQPAYPPSLPTVSGAASNGCFWPRADVTGELRVVGNCGTYGVSAAKSFVPPPAG
jgi:hypothetical protein